MAMFAITDGRATDEMYLSGEPAEVFTRIAAAGLLEQLGVHSSTSQYGQLTNLARFGELIRRLRDGLQTHFLVRAARAVRERRPPLAARRGRVEGARRGR